MTGLPYCGAGCIHGGLCTLAPGHAGLHSSGGYCTYTDAEAISRESADMLASDTPLGALLVGMQSALERACDD